MAIIGKPNAGKSTLLNQLLGRKLSITTPKAQTTRHRIFGIDTRDDYQIVYSDTPGLIRPKYELQRSMVGAINESLEDADLIILLVSAEERFPEDELQKLAQNTSIPKILAINKADLVTQQVAESRLADWQQKADFVESLFLCAKTGEGALLLKDYILKHLPEGPQYFDPDQVSNRPERFFVSEIIREKLFLELRQEIPYSTEVSIDEFQDGDDLFIIHATIHVERKSQKGMIIGKGGRMLKQIGSMARKDIEKFLGRQVFLKLYVRVSEGWKDSKDQLRGFGYN